MKNLLIDIGNSSVKIASANSGSYSVKLLKRFSYSKSDFEKDFKFNVNNLLKKIYFNITGISLLKDGNEKFLNYYFKKYFDTKPIFINREIKLPIKISYKAGIGNDRICNAVAANEIYRMKNILVIDFGTATSFTLISNKSLTGGIISPGIETSLNSLTEKTSLPDVTIKFPKKLINNNTSDNIKAGILYQSLYSVERVILELKKSYKDLFVISTGGFSGLISKKTKLINRIDRNLVLKGINLIIS